MTAAADPHAQLAARLIKWAELLETGATGRLTFWTRAAPVLREAAAALERADEPGGARYVLTLREARRLVSACEQYELGQDELVEIWRGDTGTLNAEGLLMRVQVSGADERFAVSASGQTGAPT